MCLICPSGFAIFTSALGDAPTFHPPAPTSQWESGRRPRIGFLSKTMRAQRCHREFSAQCRPVCHIIACLGEAIARIISSKPPYMTAGADLSAERGCVTPVRMHSVTASTDPEEMRSPEKTVSSPASRHSSNRTVSGLGVRV